MDECVAAAVAEAVAVAVTEAVAEADQSIHDQSIHDPSIRAGVPRGQNCPNPHAAAATAARGLPRPSPLRLAPRSNISCSGEPLTPPDPLSPDLEV